MATSKYLNPDNAKANKKGPKAYNGKAIRATDLYQIEKPVIKYKKAVPPYKGSNARAKGGR